ncbi:hypothetical protein [Microbacterium sp. SMR1]|uniref:hypothetical protein n=1 Tax=Microbacterium sp. SMR1 TaxID=1497340 RepID=UPI0011BF1094|nr:hypothetical protein [Microbacterium sp. SMR1]
MSWTIWLYIGGFFFLLGLWQLTTISASWWPTLGVIALLVAALAGFARAVVVHRCGRDAR